MALVSFRLFYKNLGNLQEFFGHMDYRPPGKKLPVRLWLTHEGASDQLTYATDIIKEIKGDVKNQP